MRDSLQKHAPRIRWCMLISHHPPCDYDRTLVLFGLRVCSRCLGMVAGACTGLCASRCWSPLSSLWLFIACLGLCIPAAVDFSAHELMPGYCSYNSRRVLTGYLFGMSVAICSIMGVSALPNSLLILSLFVYLCVMEFVIAILFRRKGHLDDYVARYAEAVYVNDGHEFHCS